MRLWSDFAGSVVWYHRNLLERGTVPLITRQMLLHFKDWAGLGNLTKLLWDPLTNVAFGGNMSCYCMARMKRITRVHVRLHVITPLHPYIVCIVVCRYVPTGAKSYVCLSRAAVTQYDLGNTILIIYLI